MAIFPVAPVRLPKAAELDSSRPCLRPLWKRFSTSPETLVLLLVVLVGVGTGLSVVAFHRLIALVHDQMLNNVLGAIAPGRGWTLACMPLLGGIILGLMRWCWRDFGPNLTVLATTVPDAQERYPLRPVTKLLAASVSLGTGASLGREGPSVETGAHIGMLVGQLLKVSQERLHLLLGAGAAAGLAAGFNAPIAGVFFALEVVLKTPFASAAVSVVLLAAVVSALIAQMGLGAQPAFSLPVYEVRSSLELPLYLGLGLCASLVSLAYVEALKLAQQLFQGHLSGWRWLQRLPLAWHPCIGGACLGAIALFWPQALGIGYETVEAILGNVPFPLPLLVQLLVVKLVMTALSLGSGLVGGIFAPAMFLGAVLGAAYGQVLALVFSASPIAIADPPAYAMVGMAAVLAGSARSPLTAILLLFELTRDYRIILPLMAAVGISVWLVEWLKPKTTSGLKLQEMGLNLEADQTPELLQQIPVVEAMRRDCLMIPDHLSVLAAGHLLMDAQMRSALVVDAAKQLVGIITLQDLQRAIARTQAGVGLPSLKQQKVGENCTTELVYVYSDESVADALARMSARGLHQVPVVERPSPHRLLGVLEAEAIALTCRMVQTRKLLEEVSTVKEEVSTVKVVENLRVLVRS